MNRVVFARYRYGAESESRRVSHVIDLLVDANLPGSVTALCGEQFPPGVLELMPQWAGMPCLACTLRMPAERPAEHPDPTMAPLPRGHDDHDVPEAPGEHVYAAAFSGELLVHLLPESAQRGRSLGRTVAVSECGHLAFDWTDGTCLPPPRSWQICTECATRVQMIMTIPSPD